MRRTIPLLIAMLAASSPAVAQKTAIDYAHEFDFSLVETFEYVRTEETNAPDELTDNRIKNAIIRELFEGGLNSASSDPDLYVTYQGGKPNKLFKNMDGTGFLAVTESELPADRLPSHAAHNDPDRAGS